MSQAAHQDLSGVPETLLIPLYYRALETQRPDAMIRDEKAAALIEKLSSNAATRSDLDQIEQVPMNEVNRVLRIMLTREMDRYARDFLARSSAQSRRGEAGLSRHPQAVVVHIGCGLDSRFSRVDDGQVEWYDLDVAEIIALRRKLIGDEGGRYHLLACSVLEDAWLEVVKVHAQRPILFLAEGVFMYFTAEQVKSLLLTLRDHFPGAELVFDSWTPLQIWIGNRMLSKSRFAGLMRWGFWRGQELEAWGQGIRLLDEWGYFDRPEPRLISFRRLALVFRLLKPMRVFHFQLEKAGA